MISLFSLQISQAMHNTTTKIFNSFRYNKIMHQLRQYTLSTDMHVINIFIICFKKINVVRLKKQYRRSPTDCIPKKVIYLNGHI